MIITILIITVAVFFGIKKLYRLVVPAKNQANTFGCMGNCGTCRMAKNNGAKIVFKSMKVD